MGDTVYFVGLADPTVKEYTGTIAYEDLQDASVALLIDQKEYVAFKIDDIEAFQSSIDLKGSQTERAGYKLRDKADKSVFGLYAGAGITIDATSGVTSANVLSKVSKVVEKLDEANIPGGQRWMTITPWFKQKMILAGIKFQINNGMEGEKGGLEFCNYQETDFYVSNNITTTGSEGSRNSKMLAGSYNSIVYKDQILKSRFIADLENSFAGGYSALHVYGRKVLKPTELILLDATEAAETTI
jgi:hypothetical protein